MKRFLGAASVHKCKQFVVLEAPLVVSKKWISVQAPMKDLPKIL